MDGYDNDWLFILDDDCFPQEADPPEGSERRVD